MPPKAYFLLSNTDIPPDAVHLGQIVRSLHEPHRPISPAQTVPRSYTSIKKDFELSTSTAQATSVGLIAHFLTQLGSPVSGGVAVGTSRKTSTYWNFASLETTFFEPDQTYVDKSIQHPDVREALRKSKLFAVYMITGLKIARGASYSNRTSRNLRTSSDLSVDSTTLTGVPLSAGPEVDFEKSAAKSESCSSCSDFVWAVRVRKIRLSFSNKVVVKDVYGGDFYGLDNKIQGLALETSDEEEDTEKEVNGGDLDERDLGTAYSPRGFKGDTAVDEDGEECAVFW